MKTIKNIVAIAFVLFSSFSLAQDNSVGINTTSPNSNAVLELVSPNSNQGFLVPRVTTVQRENMDNSFSIAENGLMVFDTDENLFYYWKDGVWNAGLGVLNILTAGGDLTGTYPNPLIRLGAVSEAKLQDLAVSTDKLQNNSVTTGKIDNGAITTAKIANLAVTGEKLEDVGITPGTYGTEAFNVLQLTFDSKGRVIGVTEVTIQIGSDNINDGSIQNVDIADATITISKINTEGNANTVLTVDGSGNPVWTNRSEFASSALAQNNIYIGNSSGVAEGLPVGGDVTVTNNGTVADVQLNTGSVTTNEILNNTILADDIASNAVDTDELAPDAVTNSELADNAVRTENIVDGQVQTGDLGADAVTNAKVANDAIRTENIVDGQVQTSDIADANVTTVKLAADAVDNSKLADNAVQTENILDDAVTKEKINADVAGTGLTQATDGSLEADFGNLASTLAGDGLVANGNTIDANVDGTTLETNADIIRVRAEGITANEIASNAVDTDELAPDAVTNSELADNAVRTENIVDGQVQTPDIADLNITTDKLATDAVDNTKLADNAVQTENIADGTISNIDVNNSAAIAGTKIDPDFGNQDIITTGNTLLNGNLTLDGGTVNVDNISTDLNTNAAATDLVTAEEVKDYVDTQVDAENDLTQGSIFVGDATNNQSEVDASGDGNILVGDGTTVNSVAVSGDLTIDNTGLTDLVAGAVEDDEVDNDLTIDGGDIDNTPIDGSVIGGTTPAAGSFTVTNTDNLTLDGNTLSSTDLNGNVILDPNGTGVVDVSTSLISNVTDPVGAQDAATRNYVDTQVDAENDLTQGSIFVGDATNNQSEVDASGDGNILVGDGTTVNSVAVSGDLTIDNTGATDLVNDAVSDDEVVNTLTIDGGDIDNTPIDGSVIGGTTPAAGSFTVTNTDNLTLDGNTLSSTDLNGNVILDPNGTGVVDVSTSLISNVTDPVGAQDAATRNYVDTQVDAENDLTQGSIFVGDATNNQSEVDASGDGNILVGDGTTVNSVAVSGDLTIDNTGLTDLVAGAVEDDEVDNDLTIDGGDIDNTPIDGSVIGGTTPAAGSFTVTNTDNLTLDGNTLSSTDLNGNVILDPNGTGVVDVSTSLISNVTDPVGAQDAATRNYVDTQVDAENDLTQGSVFVGDATNNQSEVDASGDGNILVGDGTTVNSVAVSGDLTIDNTGATDLVNDAVSDDEVVNTLTIDGGDIDNTPIDGSVIGGTTPAAGSFTVTNTDNLTLDGNTLSSTDLNGNVILDPNGTGVVDVSTSLISNVTDPVGAQDAATRNYVDTQVDAENDLTQGSIFVGDATNNQSEVDASGDGNILVGDGTTVNSVAVSGDLTIDNTGATDLVNDAVSDDEVVNTLTIDGGDIDNTPIDGSVIGGTTPAAGSFTVTNTDNLTLDGNTLSSTDLNGNVILDPNGTGVVDVSTSLISNVTDPVGAQDAATRNYVDTQVDAENDLTQGSIFVGDATNNQSEVDASGDGNILVGDGTTVNSVAVSGDLTIDNTGATDLVNDAVSDDEVVNTLTIDGGDIDNTPIDGSVIGGTTPAAGSFTVTNTDNLTLDGNTLSSTDLNGNVILDPNGTGVVDVSTSLISNVTDPVGAQDAATRNYVDTQVDAENDLTQGSIFVGDATNNQSEVDASGDGNILVGDGTTVNSVAVSGDLTIDNTGATDLVNDAVSDDEVVNTLTIDGGDIDNTPIDGSVIGGTTPAAGSFTVTNTDNLTLDGNTLSSTDLNGNVILDPNGTGVVDVSTSLISNVTDPVGAQDAATRNYVDTQVDAENDLTQGSIFVGDATNNQSEVDASGDGNILVGDGTTVNSVAVSGDLTIDNTGATDLVNDAVSDDEVVNTLTIDGGDIDNTPIDGSVIGGTTPAAGSFTVTNTDNLTLDGNTLSSTDLNGNVILDPNGTGVVDVSTSLISNVTDPVGAQDAATRNYVDTQVDAENDLTQGSIFVGDATNNQSEVDASSDGNILVGDGTTVNSVAVSGDLTIDNTGLTDLVAGAVEDDEVDNDLTIDGGDIDNTPIDGSVIGGTTPAAGSFTVTNTDNLTLDGNTLSSTDLNGNVILDPNGTGVVDVSTSLISNVTDPVGAQDAATRNYVDTQVDAENDLTQGSIFVGDATNNQSEVDASGDGNILVGDGTTVNSVAVSGDLTIDNTGATDLVNDAVSDDEVVNTLTIDGGDIDNTPIDGSVIGGTTPAAGSFTVTNTDNLTLDGNTLSSTDLNGNVILDPNGTGVVDVSTSLISNVTDPVGAQDAATRNYVDTQVDAENDLTQGSIFVGDATNNQSEVDASGDGNILVGDGTTVNSVAVSGDLTIDNTGATDLVNDAVSDDEVVNTLTIDGGDIDNTPIDGSVIGGTTPAAGSFTVTNTDNLTLDGNTLSSTDLNGNVILDPNGTGVVDVSTSLISNVTDPVGAQDAATRNYVDTQVDAENDLTQGSIFVGDATNNQSEVDASSDGNILVGDGTTVNSVAVSGDLTIDNTGLTDLVAGAVEDDEVDNDLTIDGGDIDNTPIDGSVIGGTTPAAGSFTVTNTDNLTLDGNTLSSTDLNGNVILDPNGTGVVDVSTSLISNVTDPVGAQDAATRNYVDTQVDAENDLTQGSVFVGDATNNQSEVDASGDGNILVGDGTTVNSVAVSGDLTIDNTGATDLVNDAVSDDEVVNTLTIDGGDIDNTPIDGSVIGGTTPAAGSFTVTNTDNLTLDGNTLSSTDLNGNVILDPNGTGVVDVSTSLISNVTDPVGAQDAATRNYVDTQVDAENDLTQGSIFVGDATNNQSEVDASGDGNILVGDGTTVNSVAVSGDLTIDNTGATDLVNDAVSDDEVVNTLTIDGGDIDNTPIDGSVIGGTTPAAGSFTVTNTDNLTLDGNTLSSTDLNGNVILDPNGTGVVDVSTSLISNVTDPVGAQDAATRNYVDTQVDAENDLTQGSIFVGDATNNQSEVDASGDGNILVGDGTTVNSVAVSGDLTIDNTGATDLVNDAVSDDEVVNTLTIDGGDIDNTPIDGSVIGGTTPAAGSFTVTNTDNLTLDGNTLSSTDLNGNVILDPNGTGVVDVSTSLISNVTDPVGAQDAATRNYVDTQVDAENDLTQGSIFVGDATNNQSEVDASGDGNILVGDGTTVNSVAVSGDLTIDNTGATDLVNDAVSDDEVVNTLTIDGGDIDNTPIDGSVIGGTTPAAGSFTVTNTDNLTLDGNTLSSTDLNGNVILDPNGTGVVDVSTSLISNVTDPVGAQDAATRNYVDTQVDAENDLTQGSIFVGDATNNQSEVDASGDGNILVGDGTTVNSVAVSGDLTIDNTGATDLVNDAVSDDEVVNTLTIDGGDIDNTPIDGSVIGGTTPAAGSFTVTNTDNLTLDGNTLSSTDLNGNVILDPNGTGVVDVSTSLISNVTDPVGAQDAATRNYVDTQVDAENDLTQGSIFVGDATNNQSEVDASGDGNILVGDGTTVNSVAVSGDLTIDNTGATDLVNDAVSDDEVVNTLTIDGGDIDNTPIDGSVIGGTTPAAGSFTVTNTDNLTLDGNTLSSTDLNGNVILDPNGTGVVDVSTSLISNVTDPVGAQDAATRNYVDTQVDAENDLTQGSIFVGDATNNQSEVDASGDGNILVGDGTTVNSVAVSGDLTIDNTGATDLVNDAVSDDEVVNTLTIDGGDIDNTPIDGSVIGGTTPAAGSFTVTNTDNLTLDGNTLSSTDLNGNVILDPNGTGVVDVSTSLISNVTDPVGAQDAATRNYVDTQVDAENDLTQGSIFVGDATNNQSEVDASGDGNILVGDGTTVNSVAVSGDLTIDNTGATDLVNDAVSDDEVVNTLTIDGGDIDNTPIDGSVIGGTTPAAGSFTVTNTDNLTLDGNTLSSTDLNGNVILDPNGTGVVDVSTSLISNVTDPVGAQDAATRNYVDTQVDAENDLTQGSVFVGDATNNQSEVDASGDGNILVGDGTTVNSVAVSGDLTIDNTGATDLVNDAVSDDEVVNTLTIDGGDIDNTPIDGSVIGGTTPAAGSFTVTNTDNLTLDGNTLSSTDLNGNVILDPNGTGVVDVSTSLISNVTDPVGAQDAATRNYVDTQVDAENDLTQGSIFVGDATNNQSEVDASGDGNILVGDGTTVNSVAVSGDLTIDNTGATDLVNDAVSDDEVVNTLTIDGGDIDNTPIDGSVIGGTTPAAGSFTVTNTDNLTLDGNTLSSTDLNGNVILDPNGTGVVDVSTSLISNVTDPVGAQDAATRNYVDTQVDAENDLTQGSIFVGDATNNQSEVDASGDGNILVGDGTTVNSVAVSGDLTIDNTGATDLVNDAVSDDEVVNTLTIDGGDIDNTPIDGSVIGGTTPAAGSFTVTNTDNLTLDGNTLSSTDLNGNVILDPNGTGVVDVSTSLISNVTDPVGAQDAATRNYVDTQVDAENDLTQGSIFVGDATNNQSEVDASGDGNILVGDGTTVNSVAVSGDLTIDNTGATDLVNDAVSDDEVVNTLTIDGGDIDNTPIDGSVIGGTTPAAGSFTVTNTDNLTLDGNTLSSTDLNGNVILDPNGTGVVDVSTSLISNVTDPVGAQDAATRNYVDTQVDAENDLTQGSIFVGDATNNQSEVDASGDGNILVGDGTTVNSVAVSGDLTIDNTGATDLVNDAVSDDEVVNTLTIDGGDIDNTPIDGSVIGGTTPAAGSFTVTNTDNLTLDGNTLSSTDLNGNVILDPNGTGVVDVSTSLISNVTDPVGAQDAATRNYVDTQVDAENDLTQGSIFVGDATNNQSEVDASGDGNILVGDGTTVNSVAVSGDLTIDNTGATDLVNDAVSDDEVVNTLTIDGGDIDNTPIDGSVIGGTTPAAGSFTVTNTDNLTLDGNTLSSTDLNGNVILDPNGTGVVDVSTSLISNVTDPVGAQDAATRNYVDTQVDAENDLTQGSIFVGDATNNQSEVDASSDGNILVGDGTTVNSVAVSGDLTIDNTGLTDLVAGAVEDDEVDNDLTIDGGDIDNTPIDGSVIGGTTPAAGSFTVTNTDNLTLDGNTLSSTDLNGNVILDPNGTGVVDVSTSLISNVTDPVGAQDAATKNYVDSRSTNIDISDDTNLGANNGITLTGDQVGLSTIASNTILGNNTVGAAVPTALTTSELRTLINVEDNAAADQNASQVPYSNSGSGMVAINTQAAIDELDGRLDANTTAISGKQDSDAGLTSISGLTTGADQMVYTTGSDVYATTALTGAARALLDDPNASAQRTTLGLVIGTNVQAYDADLDTYAGITPSTDVQAALGAANDAALRTEIGLTIGTDIQAYDAGLNSISGLTTTSDQMIYTTAPDVYATTVLTTAGRNLLDDANVTAQRTTLGLGSIATQDASSVNISGGSIDGAAIGATTASTGRFSSLTVTGLSGSAGTYNGIGGSFQINASGAFSTSDIRLKENIELLQNTLLKLDQLGGYNYNYKADKEKKKQIGVIAQELERVFPELIILNDQGYKMVNYQGLIPVLMQAIKEQQLLINSLNNKVANQESKLSELASDNQEMKKDLDLIKKMLLGDKTVQKED